MGSRWKCALAALVFAAAGCASQNQSAATLPATAISGDASITSAFGKSPIKYVIIIVQENRTPDNLFQGLKGADIASSGKNSKGQTIQLQPVPLEAAYDIGHSHEWFLKEWDHGKIDGFDRVGSSHHCPTEDTCAYGYVPQSETQPYLDMASQYAFADRMFQSNQGPSFPAHQYLISGTSTVTTHSQLRAADNPYAAHDRNNGGGCNAIDSARVLTIDPSGTLGDPVYPCFERPTLGDLLDAKAITWRFYQMRRAGGLWHPYDAIKHIRFGPDYKNVVAPSNAILADISKAGLANVSWVVPSGVNSDHANSRGKGGPAWVASIVNAVGKSRYWNQCAIFVTWDDWGGWFDHVAPPVVNSYELGFRVPLVLVSPYAKRAYVSHTQYEFGSILKFVEETFGTDSLDTTDVRANSAGDMFDFRQRARRFVPIAAPAYSDDASVPDSD